jgi:hypothetical protein
VSGLKVRFEARHEDGRERIELIRVEGRRFFGKVTRSLIPVDDWIIQAPTAARPAVARLLQAIGDGSNAPDGSAQAEASDNAVCLHPVWLPS